MFWLVDWEAIGDMTWNRCRKNRTSYHCCAWYRPGNQCSSHEDDDDDDRYLGGKQNVKKTGRKEKNTNEMTHLCSQGENGVCRATIGGGNDDPLRAYACEDAEKHVAAIREAKHDDEDQQRPGPSYTAFQRKSLDIPPWIGIALNCSTRNTVGKMHNCRWAAYTLPSSLCGHSSKCHWTFRPGLECH